LWAKVESKSCYAAFISASYIDELQSKMEFPTIPNIRGRLTTDNFKLMINKFKLARLINRYIICLAAFISKSYIDELERKMEFQTILNIRGRLTKDNFKLTSNKFILARLINRYIICLAASISASYSVEMQSKMQFQTIPNIRDRLTKDNFKLMINKFKLARLINRYIICLAAFISASYSVEMQNRI
jgi:uncharacterized coiled-coil protein SlyX